MRGLETGTLIQNLFTFAKTAALLGLIVVGLTLGVNRESAAWTSSWWDPEANGLDLSNALPSLGIAGSAAFALVLGKAMIGPLFSQSAWNSVTFTAGETRNPGRTLPLALVLGCGTVVVLYFLANVAYVVTLPLSAIQNAPKDRVGTLLMNAALGDVGTKLMAAAILVSTFGCVNGLIFSGARVYFAMARDGLFFARAGTTNRRRVPAAALTAQGLWAAFLVLPVTVATDAATKTMKYGNLYSQLLDYIIPVDLSFYTLMVGAVAVLRSKAPAIPRPYRTIGYPLPVFLYVALASLLVLDFIVLSPGVSGVGFLIVLAGIPVYLFWSRSAAARPNSNSNPEQPQ